MRPPTRKRASECDWKSTSQNSCASCRLSVNSVNVTRPLKAIEASREALHGVESLRSSAVAAVRQRRRMGSGLSEMRDMRVMGEVVDVGVRSYLLSGIKVGE